jgi:chaperone required for assembly of F1-ATPase
MSSRFFKNAHLEECSQGFQLLLDNKPAKTPAKAPLVVPSLILGEALAAEWNACETISPRSMPLTRLINSTIDGVAARVEEVGSDVLRYAASDLVCYRANSPERLVAEQKAAWDPARWGAVFKTGQGVSFIQQPEHALEVIRILISKVQTPFQLAALHSMTTLTGSALICLCHVQGLFEAQQAWRASQVDILFQQSLWGVDAEQQETLEDNQGAFMAASTVYHLTLPESRG